MPHQAELHGHDDRRGRLHGAVPAALVAVSDILRAALFGPVLLCHQQPKRQILSRRVVHAEEQHGAHPLGNARQHDQLAPHSQFLRRRRLAVEPLPCGSVRRHNFELDPVLSEHHHDSEEQLDVIPVQRAHAQEHFVLRKRPLACLVSKITSCCIGVHNVPRQPFHVPEQPLALRRWPGEPRKQGCQQRRELLEGRLHRLPAEHGRQESANCGYCATPEGTITNPHARELVRSAAQCRPRATSARPPRASSAPRAARTPCATPGRAGPTKK